VLSGATVLSRVLAGVAAGFQFHPVFAAVFSAAAAGLAGYRKAPRARVWWAVAVVLAGWLLGDGIRVAGSSGEPTYLIVWALAGLAVGYVVPALLGAYVGRQVHRGTGYLSAAAIAIMLVGALSALADPIATALMGVAR